MARVKAKNTKPEVQVRRCAHKLGYRFRLHRRDLPGKPDIVFPGRKKAIFVHGCFWHHHDCKRGTIPETNREFWEAKLASNVERDATSQSALKQDGWSVLVLWECQTRNEDNLIAALRSFL